MKKMEVKNIYSLSPMQEGILFHSILDGNSSAYFVQVAMKIQGEINFKIFEQSFAVLVERYDILRTVFEYEKFKEPVQVVFKERKSKIYYEDLSTMSSFEAEEYIKNYNTNDINKPFNLKKDMMMRISIFKTDEKLYKIIWSFHHIIMDGWCNGIIMREFFEIYQSLISNEAPKQKEVFQYIDYIKWLETQNKSYSLKW